MAVERAVTENNNLPVLKNILLQATDAKIKISATNLEIGINSFTTGKITENGGLTVPFSTFNSVISNLDSERISLESDKNNLNIKTDNYQGRIQSVSEEEFPIIPKIESQDNYLEINSTILKESLLEIISAAHFSEIRPEISGILVNFEVSLIKLTATDSFRLAEKTIFDKQFKTKINKGFKIIVPLKTIQEVVRIFVDDKILSIYIDPHQILFKSEDHELISRLIDGHYPDYEQIIPKETQTEIAVDREKFLSAIKIVSSFSSKISDIKIKAKDGGRALEIYSASQYLGENSYLVPVKTKGEEFKEIAFNWRYLLDGLKAIKSKIVLFGVNGDAKPALLKPGEEANYFYLIMPIKNS